MRRTPLFLQRAPYWTATGLILFAFLVLPLLGIPDASAAETRAEKSPRKITNFSLREYRGQVRSLAEFKDDSLVVVAFLGNECPLARLYAPRLVALAREFESRGVAVLAINSNAQDSLTEIAQFARTHEITFPILKDADHQVAGLFAAERTPEVFLLDADRTVRYHGRIDDQYGIGYQRNEPTRRDLAVAIEELLAGKAVSVASTPAIGCYIGRARQVEPHGDVTYSKQIARIFNKRCVECHRAGEIAPFPLETYDDTVGWGATIAEVISEERMPPWNANPKHGSFKNDARLTDEEKQLVQTWIKNGCPEGDAAELPEKPAFVDGWRIPEPDQIIKMRDKPFTVPAEGVVAYQYFEVDPDFKEDKYVVAAEARPGNRAVVHHIIAYLRPPGERDRRNLGAMLIGYAPGTIPLEYTEGKAIHVPAGWTLLFEMHYTPNGTEQQDLSYIGLKFTTKDKVTREIQGGAALNGKFEIPPGADNYKVVAEDKIRRDLNLLSMTPHMHLRGKAFRYDVVYPDGTQETLLDVPRYDFNWQLRYELAQPKLLPKGSRILCTALYDNSADNPNNPDPGKAIRWGQQSWDEMMIGFYTAVAP